METNLRKLYGVLQKLMFGNYKESKSNIKPARKTFCRSQDKHVYTLAVAVTRYANIPPTYPPTHLPTQCSFMQIGCNIVKVLRNTFQSWLSEDRELVSEDRGIVSENRNIVSEDREIVSEDRKIVSQDRKIVPEDPKIVSEE